MLDMSLYTVLDISTYNVVFYSCIILCCTKINTAE